MNRYIYLFILPLFYCLNFNTPAQSFSNESEKKVSLYSGLSVGILNWKNQPYEAFRLSVSVELPINSKNICVEPTVSYVKNDILHANDYTTTRLNLDCLINYTFGKQIFFSIGMGLSSSLLLSQEFENTKYVETKSFNIAPTSNIEIGFLIFSEIGVSISYIQSFSESIYYEYISRRPSVPLEGEKKNNLIEYISLGLYYKW